MIMKSSHWIQSLYSVLFCFVAIDKYSVSTVGQILRKTRDSLRSVLPPAPQPFTYLWMGPWSATQVAHH